METKCKKLGNKGFSLVELIIVIAIMAILVGVMAPQLLKYIEKSKVSADAQLCDAVKKAIVVTMSDPEVVSSTNAADKQWIQDFSNPGEVNSFPAAISSGRANAAFYKNVVDVCGFDIVGFHDFNSSAKVNGGLLCYAVSSTGSDFVVFINNSDDSGNRATNSVASLGGSDSSVYDSIETYGVIYVK